jgi:hypothetical protein
VESLRAIEHNKWVAGSLGKNGRQYYRDHYDWPVIEKKYVEMIDRLSKSSPLKTTEATAGWFERQKVNCAAGADVVAAVPAGPTITQEAYIPRPQTPVSPPVPDRRITDRSRPFQRDRRHHGRRHTNGRPHSGGHR